MAVFTRRSTNIGLLAVAVAGLAAASTGMALAAESRPSMQVEICLTQDGERVVGPWEIKVTGMNQNGDTITENFAGDGCTILGKDETPYWWALGQNLKTEIDGSPAKDVTLDDKPEFDGKLAIFTLERPKKSAP